MRRPIAAAVLLAAALLGGPADAQDDNPFAPTDGDWQALQSCLEERSASGGKGECVGAISGPCLEDPENASTPAMNGCLSKEADMWDHYLNQWYDVLKGQFGEGSDKALALRDSQRAWLKMRDSTCEFEAMLWDGGTGATAAANECFMRETGRRALLLGDTVDFVMQ